MLPTGFRTFHFVSFLYVFLFSFLFLLFRFFSHYFVFVFLRFVFFRFFSLLFSLFSFRFFSFRFFSFLFVFFPFLSLQVPSEIFWWFSFQFNNFNSVYILGTKMVFKCRQVVKNIPNEQDMFVKHYAIGDKKSQELLCTQNLNKSCLVSYRKMGKVLSWNAMVKILGKRERM